MLPVVLPLVSSAGLALVAATVLVGTTSYLYWMVPTVALMLTNAATNSWDLMLGLAKYKLQRAGGATSRGVDTSGPDSRDAGPSRPV